MLPTVYQGLAQKTTLTKLTIKFPSKRIPRPIALVPPMANLVSLTILHIDPLCYADDISLTLLGSKNLRDLKLHWSPRMRKDREPSVVMSSYWGRNLAAGYSPPLSKISLYNLYASDLGACHAMMDVEKLEEVTIINCMDGHGDDGSTAFVDRGWRKAESPQDPRLKIFRTDKVSRNFCDMLASFRGLEKLYLISGRSPGNQQRTTSNSSSPSGESKAYPNSPVSSTSSSPPNQGSSTGLKDELLETITANHGQTLKHLLLPPQWRLTSEALALIIRQCPNLEQLGIGVEFANFTFLRLLVPFLKKLIAIRLLENPDDPSFTNKMRELDDGRHEKKISDESNGSEWPSLRWFNLGELVFEVGKHELVPQEEGSEKMVYRRPVYRRAWDANRHIDILAMDTFDP